MRGQRRPDGSVSARRAIIACLQILNQNQESRAWSVWQAESFSIKRFLWTTSGHQPRQAQIAKAEKAMPYAKFIERFTVSMVRDGGGADLAAGHVIVQGIRP